MIAAATPPTGPCPEEGGAGHLLERPYTVGGGGVPQNPPPSHHSNTHPCHPMPPRADKMERAGKKLGWGKGTNQGG